MGNLGPSDIIFHVTTLVRPEKPDDSELEGLRSRVGALETLLGERSAEVLQVKSDLDAFRIRYRQQVGLTSPRF